MSFAGEVKNEIFKTGDSKSCCRIAELCGMFCFAGTPAYENGNISLRLATESAAVVKRFIWLTKKEFEIDAKLQNKIKETRSGTVYSVVIKNTEDAQKFLLGIMLFHDGRIVFSIPGKIKSSNCCAKSFVRGALMGGGFVVNPEKGYHLEFVTHRMNLARDFKALLEKLGFGPKITPRGANYVVYFKNGDEISDILALTGAHKAMMDYTNTRIEKDTKNYINRTINCETANLDKTAKAAAMQIVAIEKLKKTGILNNLSDELLEVANLRIENPHASLAEIASLSKSKLTKSGVSHRMRKLLEIASKI